ncbi:phosphatase [Streptomyces sp. QHH-9511]|uniref:PP2C family serine/threonine-protein phosphatase n=1 Tax=Streptomyces sp. QHH-9511 TaxID=2684468 RepID=UPI0013179D5C|nr:PP2C family serine/threonine-protein phosphatase [Streptomyces sp. QHH-9511]QGZ48968.1 phosphatase [Streptomyces sp. QHH-9511]
MSQMPQHDFSACPGCAEPLESGDRFCGACGYDLSAVPAAAPEPDRPTVAIGTPVSWPEPPAREPGSLSTSTQHPGDLPGTDSGGHDLPTTPPAHGAPGAQAQARASQPQVPAAQAQGPQAFQAQAQASQPQVPEVPAAPPARDLPTIPVRTDGPHAAATSGDGLAALAEGTVPAPVPTADGDFALAAPDPRAAAAQPAPPQSAPPQPVADPRTATPPAGTKLCVACRAGHVDPDGYCENCGHAQPRERDHMEQELSTVAAVSDRGLRHHRNEDAFAVSATALPDGSPATLAIVCDGVSSATRPDEASAAAAQAANQSLLDALPRGTHPQQAMHEAIVAAAEAVNALAEEPGQGAMEHDPHRHQNAPACTIVGAVVADGLLIVGWVGDSRVYWVPDDRTSPPARLTQDDSWAAQMVAAGLMNEAEAYADERAHAITGWLGADAYELEPHTSAFKPDRPGVVVVCTDGLWNYAEAADDMARVVPADATGRLLHGAQVLVGHALDGGGHDNVTVALLPFTLSPQGAGSA